MDIINNTTECGHAIYSLTCDLLSVLAVNSSPSTWEVEAEEEDYLQVQSQPRMCRETLSLKKKRCNLCNLLCVFSILRFVYSILGRKFLMCTRQVFYH